MGWLVEGLRKRWLAGALSGLAALSCDNLSGNGARFRRATLQFAQASGQAEVGALDRRRGALSRQYGRPRSPRPRIDALRAEAAERLGLVDAWPVQRERFAQWVIGGGLGADASTFAEAGVTLTADVAAFERAKLRLLNGAHSTLAYVGLRLGHATVAQAMADARLAAFIETLMRRDVAASLAPTAGLDLDAYISEILGRFRNPAIVHQLSQIAWDGSQKLPFRLLATIAEALAASRSIERLTVGVAAWMLFARERARAGAAITDPLADVLTEIGLACDGDPADDVSRFLTLGAVFPDELVQDSQFCSALERSYGRLVRDPTQRALWAISPLPCIFASCFMRSSLKCKLVHD